ncbi:MAG: hypothetical protein ACO3A4_07740 [Silvanigrellaceae bacterium]
MNRLSVFFISLFSLSATAKTQAEREESLKKAQEQLMRIQEKTRKSCEDMKTRILQSPECSVKHAEASTINCSGEGDSYKIAFEISSSCVKKKSLTKEQKEKLKGAIADYKKNINEVVKCEAFDEQDVSAGSFDAKRKDCRKMLENKIETERCMPGAKPYLRYKFTAGSDEKRSLMVICKK